MLGFILSLNCHLKFMELITASCDQKLTSLERLEKNFVAVQNKIEEKSKQFC